MGQIALNTILQRTPDHLFGEIDGEIVMLNVKKGEYYNINNVGSDIWNQLKNPCTLETLVKYLTDTYDVDEEQCIHETIPLLDDLLKKGILMIV